MSFGTEDTPIGPNQERQEQSHPHMSIFAPDNDNSIMIPDLGLDCVHQLEIQNGKLFKSKDLKKAEHPGQGPRHLAIHPSFKFGYLLNEMGSHVSVFAYSNGKLVGNEIQNISSLPANWTGVQKITKTVKYSHAADIHVSPDGNFLYASNRGHESLAIFSVDKNSGLLTLVGHQDVIGSIPRSFAITPDGDFILVACQDTHRVNVFRVDKKTGLLKFTGKSASISSPMKVHFPKFAMPTFTPQ